MEAGLAAIALAIFVVGLVGLTFTLFAVRAQAAKEVSDLYDQVIRFRVEHPEVVALARQWKPGHFAKVYGPGDPADRPLVIYHAYVELCLSYCNATLLAWRGNRLSDTRFYGYHRLLMKQMLTENNPIIEDLLARGKYVSTHLVDFRQSLDVENWNWREEHQQLAN